MKRKLLARLIWSIFNPEVAANTTSYQGSIFQFPPGVTPDPAVNWARNGLVAVAGGSGTTFTLTAAQFLTAVIDYASSAGGGITVTTPTAADIIALAGRNIPQDGTANLFVEFYNDNTGQTVTLAGGTGVTIVGTATVATNVFRRYLVNINPGAGTVTMINMGSRAL